MIRDSISIIYNIKVCLWKISTDLEENLRKILDLKNRKYFHDILYGDAIRFLFAFHLAFFSHHY